MGDSYERIQEKADLEFVRLRAKLILEVESFISKDTFNNDKKRFPKWLHVLVPKDDTQIETQGTVLKSVKTRVEGLKAQMKTQIGRLETQNVEMKAQNVEMKAQNVEMKTQIGRLEAQNVEMKAQLSEILRLLQRDDAE